LSSPSFSDVQSLLPTSAIATNANLNAVTSIEVNSPSPLHRDQSLTNIMSFLPPAIWLSESPWSAPPASNVKSYTVNDLDIEVYREASRPNLSARLQIHGRNVTEMVSVLGAKLAAAAGQGDFSEVLSPVRDFQM
jgi:hypothetical protein